MFYLILIGNIKDVLKNEELRAFIIMVIVGVSFITLNLFFTFKDTLNEMTFEQSFRNAYFHVAAIISTTGYSISNFITWPSACIMILMFFTLTGACAGSTAGGLKITRLNILVKSFVSKIRNMISPRKVDVIKIDGKVMDKDKVSAVDSYFAVYVTILIIGTFLISFDGFDFATNFTATLTCVSNVGPGYTELVGPYGSFAGFSYFSKFILTIIMIAGRLEFFPILVLFSPRTWKKRI
jgi:trk system potassium uptake protein TrkH